MTDLKPEFKAHLFVCTNAPTVDGKCGSKNAESLRRKVKEQCAIQPWGKSVRVNAAGCLGQCERGIAAVIYPQQIWHLDLKENETSTLFESMKTLMETNK